MIARKAGVGVVAALLVAGAAAVSYAQGTGGAGQDPRTGMQTGVGGTATSGTGVRTGTGALSQPVPPATSTVPPQQGIVAPQQRLTYPPPHPFGTR